MFVRRGLSRAGRFFRVSECRVLPIAESVRWSGTCHWLAMACRIFHCICICSPWTARHLFGSVDPGKERPRVLFLKSLGHRGVNRGPAPPPNGARPVRLRSAPADPSDGSHNECRRQASGSSAQGRSRLAVSAKSSSTWRTLTRPRRRVSRERGLKSPASNRGGSHPHETIRRPNRTREQRVPVRRLE